MNHPSQAKTETEVHGGSFGGGGGHSLTSLMGGSQMRQNKRQKQLYFQTDGKKGSTAVIKHMTVKKFFFVVFSSQFDSDGLRSFTALSAERRAPKYVNTVRVKHDSYWGKNEMKP